MVSAQTPGKKGGGPPSESVRPAGSRQIRTSVAGLLGWSVGTASFRQLTFFDAAVKTDALRLAYIEGFSTQKVSAAIPKNLDYHLSAEEVAAVKDKLRALNLKMPAYHADAIGSDNAERRRRCLVRLSIG